MTPPFLPHYGSSQQATLVAATPQILNLTRDDVSLRIWNSGTNTLYFAVYDSLGTARVASATDCFVPPNTILTVTKGFGMDRISLFSTAGTTCELMTGGVGI